MRLYLWGWEEDLEFGILSYSYVCWDPIGRPADGAQRLHAPRGGALRVPLSPQVCPDMQACRDVVRAVAPVDHAVWEEFHPAFEAKAPPRRQEERRVPPHQSGCTSEDSGRLAPPAAFRLLPA